MNLTNLELNKEYKNKGEICELLGVKKAVGGRNIKFQDEEFSRYFKLEKTTGYKLKVTEIYEIPLEKIDNRKGNSGKSEGSRNNNTAYGKYIDPLLINHFSKIDSYKTIYTTTNQLSKVVGLINYNYSYCFSNKNKYMQYSYKEVNEKTNKTAMYHTFGVIKKSIKDYMRSSLNRLSDLGYLIYEERYMLTYNHKTRCSTDEEEEIIKAIENEVLEYMNCTKQKLQYNDKKRKEYYEDVEKLVKSEIEHVDSIFIGYKIKLISEIKTDLSEEEIKNKTNELNRIFKERIKESRVDTVNKTANEYEHCWGLPRYSKWDKEIMNTSYLLYVDYMITSLISLNYKYIVKDVEKEITKEDIESGAKNWTHLMDDIKDDNVPY